MVNNFNFFFLWGGRVTGVALEGLPSSVFGPLIFEVIYDTSTP